MGVYLDNNSWRVLPSEAWSAALCAPALERHHGKGRRDTACGGPGVVLVLGRGVVFWLDLRDALAPCDSAGAAGAIDPAVSAAA